MSGQTEYMIPSSGNWLKKIERAQARIGLVLDLDIEVIVERFGWSEKTAKR